MSANSPRSAREPGRFDQVDSAVKLIDAIANLLGAIAWPTAITVIAIYILRRHRDAVGGVFDRAKSVVLPGGAQIDLYEKVQREHEEQVAELADRLPGASPDEQKSVLDELVGQVRDKSERLIALVEDTGQPQAVRQRALKELRRYDVAWVAFREGGASRTRIDTIEDYDRAKREADKKQGADLMRVQVAKYEVSIGERDPG